MRWRAGGTVKSGSVNHSLVLTTYSRREWSHPSCYEIGMLLGILLLQFLGWVVLLGAIYMLIDRLGVLSRPARFTEETMTRLWRESATTGGEESGPAPNRLT